MVKFQKNVLLKKYTTYKIGGPAKYFFIAKDINALQEALTQAKKMKLKVFVLGGGSNILVSDKGFGGLVVKPDMKECKNENGKIFAGSGLALKELAKFAQENSFSGIEWAGGIPGATVGGSIYGHAQAFGDKISDIVDSVQAIDLKTLKIKNFSKSQCRFSLKNSIFKKKKNLLIVSVLFKLKQGDKAEIKKKMEDFLYHRNTKHPMSFASAGSTFVNPEIAIKNKKLLQAYPELADFAKKKFIPAGYLVEKAGLAGRQIGRAKISEKHSNFIVNLGGAKAKDVLALVRLAQNKVKKIFNIKLEAEVQLVGFDKK